MRKHHKIALREHADEAATAFRIQTLNALSELLQGKEKQSGKVRAANECRQAVHVELEGIAQQSEETELFASPLLPPLIAMHGRVEKTSFKTQESAMEMPQSEAWTY